MKAKKNNDFGERDFRDVNVEDIVDSYNRFDNYSRFDRVFQITRARDQQQNPIWHSQVPSSRHSPQTWTMVE